MEFLEVADPGQLAQWHRLYLAADARPHAAPWQLAELVPELLTPWRRRRRELLIGEVAGEAVAAGYLELPLLDSLDCGYPAVYVPPQFRRRGHGGLMLAELERRLLGAGRRVAQTETFLPLDGLEDGGDHPNARFARNHGYDFGLSNVHRVLTLPVPPERLAELAADAAAHAEGYRLETYVGSMPRAIRTAVSVLDASLNVEAPAGEMQREAEAVDEAADDEAERLLAAEQRVRVRTVASREGEVVAYSDLVVPAAEPGRVYQWGTLVRRDHRGHRLGLAVKVAALQRLQESFADRTCVSTFNAESNQHMIAVNEVLGYRPVERLGEFQKLL